MKKITFLLISVLTLSALVLLNTGCEEDPEEYCEQLDPGDVCGEQVTACCTYVDGTESCVWKYNGQEYTSEEDLYNDLNCTSAIVLSSTGEDISKEIMLEKLSELMDRAHAGLAALDYQ
jgi:hypothetical protein